MHPTAFVHSVFSGPIKLFNRQREKSFRVNGFIIIQLNSNGRNQKCYFERVGSLFLTVFSRFRFQSVACPFPFCCHRFGSLPLWHARVLFRRSSIDLSSAEALLRRAGAWERENQARGGRWEGRGEKPLPLPIVHRALDFLPSRPSPRQASSERF